ncbi:transposase [uncultured Desulfatiglans sp.]|uniref:Transposase n=1 Tax=Uncultured Desulfatiglans sp. TaxID=1748965 RepID=A0A653AB96_UNCDX|nr:transposase [uncultured Desulfatiglans sp.]
MPETPLFPEGIALTEEGLQDVPRSVLIQIILALVEENRELRKRIEQLEARLNKDSSNSDRPPSSDPPFKKKKSGKKKKGTDRRKLSHPGHRQEMLPPKETRVILPEICTCGNREFPETEPYYTHQVIELPPIELEVIHFELHRGRCPVCGKMQKATVPREHRTGYGPRLSAMIAEMAGTQADSRSTIQTFCASVLGFHISLSAIQKIIVRACAAIQPHYETIGQAARQAPVNHIDETSHRLNGLLQWLWVMAGPAVAFFMIHSNRSKEAFEALIKDWTGILVSDGYGVYRKWVGLRQTCLAHLIRKAKELSERKDPDIKRFGLWATHELQRLCHMAKDPPSVGEWQAFYARLIRLITLHEKRKDDAGRFARRLRREIESLWTFLSEQGVDPTNNHAERMLRFAVLWRKSSQGTSSEKGNRWVERILSLKQTCRLQKKTTFPVLVDALHAYFRGQEPDLAWIAQPTA